MYRKTALKTTSKNHTKSLRLNFILIKTTLLKPVKLSKKWPQHTLAWQMLKREDIMIKLARSLEIVSHEVVVEVVKGLERMILTPKIFSIWCLEVVCSSIKGIIDIILSIIKLGNANKIIIDSSKEATKLQWVYSGSSSVHCFS